MSRHSIPKHVPDRGEHLVRYYGWYSNRSRGDRKRSCRTTDEIETDAAGGPDSDTPESELTKAARSTWARLIKKVYEVQVLADVLKVRDSGILQVRVRGRTR